MKLDYRKIIWVIIIILLIMLGIGWWWFSTQETQTDTENDTNTNLFPFGEFTGGIGSPDFGSQGTLDDSENISTQETEDVSENTVTSAGPKLRQVTFVPTGGFMPIMRTEEREISDISIDENGNTLQTTRIIEVANHYVRHSTIENADIYETHVTPESLETEIVVNNFIPNAEHAYFSRSGDQVIFQYWNNQENIPESYLGKITPLEMIIEPCPFSFDPVALDDKGDNVYEIHEFLNRVPQTQIARSGPNSPGNETSLAVTATITAIKNFQSIHQIDIDGAIGPSTKGKMQEVCNEQQESMAKKIFSEQDRKYSLSGYFLPKNITSISTSPLENIVFYIQDYTDGVRGVLQDLVTDTQNVIFESPFTEWSSSWNSKESIELYTRPSYAAKGFSYQLDTVTGRYFKSLEEKSGLTTLPSADNSKLFTMEIFNNGVRNAIYDRNTNRTIPTSLQTLTDKCVWANDNIHIYCAVPDALGYGPEYPDTWYQGIESYSDSLWRINTETREEELIEDIVNNYGESIDVEKILIDGKDNYLYFLDKHSEFLWSYRLENF